MARGIGAQSGPAQISPLMREAGWQRQPLCCAFLLEPSFCRGGRLGKDHLKEDQGD